MLTLSTTDYNEPQGTIIEGSSAATAALKWDEQRGTIFAYLCTPRNNCQENSLDHSNGMMR